MDASQELDRVCDDLDFITLTCPETEDSILLDSPMNIEDDEEDELLGLGSLAPSVELEEREALTLLDSPTSSPLPTPAPSAPQTSHPYACTDIQERMSAEELATMKKKAKEEEEARLARKRAKRAIKKKKSKEAKKQKKAPQPVSFN